MATRIAAWAGPGTWRGGVFGAARVGGPRTGDQGRGSVEGRDSGGGGTVLRRTAKGVGKRQGGERAALPEVTRGLSR